MADGEKLKAALRHGIVQVSRHGTSARPSPQVQGPLFYLFGGEGFRRMLLCVRGKYRKVETD